MAMPLDKDYLILNLRLGYLRKIDDRAGARVITVPDILNVPIKDSDVSARREEEEGKDDEGVPKAGLRRVISDVLPPYADDSHVVMAGLNDARKHPELTLLYSPNISLEDLTLTDGQGDVQGHQDNDSFATNVDTNRSRAISLGTGGLRHTTTIYGPGQTGALGMRVSGQRNDNSTNRRRHPLKTSSETDAAHIDSAPAIGRPFHQSQGPGTSLTSDIDALGMQVPALAVQASSSASEGQRRQESELASPRLQMESGASAIALLQNRNRSRSQPHRPNLPSGLSNVSTAFDTDLIEVGIDVDDQVRAAMPPPPPRPPRKARQSISGQSTKSASAIPTSGSAPDRYDHGQSLDGRPRSQSEATRPNQTADKFSASHGTSSGDNSTSQYTPGDAAAYMNRTHSESTLFSLASPRSTRRRGLSNKSQHSDGSAPSFDLSAVETERLHLSTFAPVDEHPEGSPIEASQSVFAAGEPLDDEAEELLLGSDVEADAQSPPYEDRRPKADMLDPWDISSRRSTLTPFNITKPRTPASGTGDTFATSVKPLHLDDVDSVGASTIPPSIGALSPDVNTVQGARVTEKGPLPQSLGSAKNASPYLKTDPITVKKNFEDRVIKSALTAMISKRSEGPSNPFTELYRGVAGSNVARESSTIVEIFFPFAQANNSPDTSAGKTRSGAHSLNPQTKSMQLSVRQDAQMEELIGYSLYCYVEEGWRPHLDEAIAPDASEDQRSIRLSTLGWTLRLVEDGEVDDDYPALDRNLTVGKFGADELAVCEATSAQIRQNQAATGAAANRPRQTLTSSSTFKPAMLAGKSAIGTTARQVVTSPSTAQPAAPTNAQGASLLSSTLDAVDGASRNAVKRGNTVNSSASNGTLFNSLIGNDKIASVGKAPPVFLRILVTPNQEVRYKTTLQVTSDRYLADVLETICKRRELGSAEKWAFVVPEKDIVVPLDRTVESLQGNFDLALIRRQDLGAQQTGALTTQSTNPNASIFKHSSRQDAPPAYGGISKDLQSVYKSYTVNRRMPTFLARHERILTIDGDWLHIIPTDSRGYSTQSATTSYPISSIVSCSQARLPSSFKLVVERESDQKRYDFEAENSKVAAEIVQEINRLMKRR